MNRLLALAGLLLLPALLIADDKPPELRLPETTKPTKLELYAKAADVVDWDKQLMGFPNAWKATEGQGVVAYVYDTGLNRKHPEFAAAADRLQEVDFTGEGEGDEQGHGSHVSSTIFGQKEVSGGARRLDKLVMLKVLKRDGSGDFSMMEKAIRWAIADMKKHGKPSVHSASLGSRPEPNTPPSQFDQRLYKAFQDSIAAGAVWCVAAGNDGPAADTVGFPARYGEELPLIVVAACNKQRQISTFSSRGRAVFVTAPGEEIVGAGLGTAYMSWAGTSMATPGIAGGLACYLSLAGAAIKPEDRQQRAADWIRSVCSFPQERNVARGYGLPDFGKLADLKAPTPPVPNPTPEKVYVVNVAELQKQGYTSVRIDLGGTPSTSSQPVPVSAGERDYAACVRAVDRGEVVQLAVGSRPADGAFHAAELPGIAPGRYTCWKENGVRKMQAAQPASPPVIQTPLFQPTCGPGGCPGGNCQPAPAWQPFGGRWR